MSGAISLTKRCTKGARRRTEFMFQATRRMGFDRFLLSVDYRTVISISLSPSICPCILSPETTGPTPSGVPV